MITRPNKILLINGELFEVVLQIGRSQQRIKKMLLIDWCFFRRKIREHNGAVRAGDGSYGGSIKRNNFYNGVLVVLLSFYPTRIETVRDLLNDLYFCVLSGCHIIGDRHYDFQHEYGQMCKQDYTQQRLQFMKSI